MAESKFALKLQKLKKGWKRSKQTYKEMFGAADLPEDVYVLKLQDIFLKESSEGKLQVRREHVVMEGEHKGVVIRDGMQLETDYGPVFLQRYFIMVGIEEDDVPDDPEELEPVLAELKERAPLCKGRVRHSGDFTNVDILSVIDDEEVSEDASGDDSESESEKSDEVDLDEMDKSELRSFIKENDLEIEDYRKMSEKELRKAIAEALEGSDDSEKSKDSKGSDDSDDSDDSGEVDLDELDKDGMLELIEENEIDAKDLGFKNSKEMKNAKEKDLRKRLEEALAPEGDEKDSDSDSDSDDDDDGKKKKKKGKEKEADEDDELLEQAKIFCGSWDVDVAEDADLDDVKSAIAECEFPEEELDEDETELLETLELSETIKESKKKGKKK